MRGAVAGRRCRVVKPKVEGLEQLPTFQPPLVQLPHLLGVVMIVIVKNIPLRQAGGMPWARPGRRSWAYPLQAQGLLLGRVLRLLDSRAEDDVVMVGEVAVDVRLR